MFSIPFRITPARTPAEEPSEVQLLVSADGGKSWQIDSHVLPSQTAFNFRAARDGEYLFIIRTMDAQGQPKNQAAMTPGMRVVVDTTPPLVDIFADRGPNGEVRARWNITDTYLDPSSFKLEYQMGANQPWQPVAVDPRNNQTPGVFSGSTTFVPPAKGAGVIVRVKAQDRAGNPTEAQISADPQGPAPATNAANPNGSVVPSYPATNPTSQPASSDPSLQRNPTANVPPDRVTAIRPGLSPSPNTNSPNATVTIPSDNLGTTPIFSSNQKWNSTNPNRTPLVVENPLAKNGVNNGGAITTAPPPVMPDRFPNDSRRDVNPFTPAATDRMITRPQTGAINPPVASKFVPEELGPQLNPGNTTRPTSDIPPGEEPRRVNSTKFELAFDPDPAAATNGTRIELFGTRDGGKGWSSYGLAPLNANAMSVRVEGEGTYGFKLVGQRKTGMTTTPKSGDLPEAWVIVDATKPEARLVAADYADSNGPELKIRWEATDSQLAARPISLFFAVAKAGPWTPIATGLDNSGSYAWRLDNRVPDRAFLRLEVRDEAGNLAAVESADPVALNPSLPTGKIRGVRPLSDDGATTRWKTWR